MSDIGRHWLCDGDCGCGVCCNHDDPPDPPFHVVAVFGDPDHRGRGRERVCGRFVPDGPCEACLMDAEKAA